MWIVTALGASAMHLFIPEYLVSLTSWQFARNWQMEIAFFDMAWSGFIIYAFKTKNHLLQKQIAIVLGCLSVFLGTNHFSGFLIEGKSLHLVFALLNYTAVFSAVLFAIASKKNSNSSCLFAAKKLPAISEVR
jgi:hypothetical protein